jgi:hypothetical protein
MSEPIFDEWMGGSGTDTLINTSTSLCAPLSTADQLGLHAMLRAQGAMTSFVLTMYHSQDGYRWFPKYRDPTTGAAISQISGSWSPLTPTLGADLYWSEPWPAPPTMRFVRLQLQFTGAGCRISIFNTSRKRSSRRRSPEEECGRCEAAGQFPAHMRVIKTLSPAEVDTVRRLGARRGAPVREKLAELGADTTLRLDRALHMAALQVLAGKD